MAKGLKRCRILACAHSNVATDNLLKGLLDIGGVAPLGLNGEVVDRSSLRVVRLGRPVSIRSSLWNYTLDALLQRDENWVGSRQRLDEAIAQVAEARNNGSSRDLGIAHGELSKARREYEVTEMLCTHHILMRADVVVSTCIGVGSEMLLSFVRTEEVRFNSVIVDEAAQCMVALP